MNRFWKKHKYGILGGILLYIPYLPFGFLLYFQLSDKVFYQLFGACILAGVVISVVTLIYKCNSARERVTRTFVMLLSFWLTILFNGSIGTVRWLDELFHVAETEAMSRATGVGYGLFHIAVLCSCIIINIVMTLFEDSKNG